MNIKKFLISLGVTFIALTIVGSIGYPFTQWMLSYMTPSSLFASAHPLVEILATIFHPSLSSLIASTVIAV